MPNVPRASGRDVIRAFERAGFVLVRTNGSHHILKKDGHPFLLSVPVHAGKTVGVGLLKKLIEDSGLTVDEFTEHLG
jgi:predicted RNA binding protein YcfA (HicA-like mRNA interferase family)